MRPNSQILIVTAHLGFLEERKIQLEAKLNYLQKVIDECKTWIEDDEFDSISFEEIMLHCLEIAKKYPVVEDESSNTVPITKTSECELDKRSIRNTRQDCDKDNCSQIVHVLNSISRSLNEQSKKIESFTRTQAEQFLLCRQQFKHDESLLKHLVESEYHCLNHSFTHEEDLHKKNAVSESAIQRDELETFPSQSHAESFSSPVDSPNDLNQFTESVKKEFVTLNEKLWKITKQMNELLAKDENTDLPSGYVGFTASVCIWGPLVSPLSQFMSDLNEYGQCTDGLMGNHKILTCFNNVQHNEGGHYNQDTGIFSVPVDGFYLICLNVNIISQGPVFVGTVVRTSGHITGFSDLETVSVKLGSALSLNIFRLNKDDELCVYKTYDYARICDRSRISCFLISKI